MPGQAGITYWNREKGTATSKLQQVRKTSQDKVRIQVNVESNKGIQLLGFEMDEKYQDLFTHDRWAFMTAGGQIGAIKETFFLLNQKRKPSTKGDPS